MRPLTNPGAPRLGSRADTLRRMGASASVAAVALALALLPRSARGEDAPADSLVAEGIRLRTERRDADAVQVFRRAVERAPDLVRAQGQLALALHATGEWVESERIMLRVLAADGEPWVRRHEAQLRESLSVVQRHLASLDVRAAGASGEVLLDGREVAALPMPAPLRIVAEPALLEVRLRGRRPFTARLDPRAGQLAVVDVLLADVPPAPTRPPPQAPLDWTVGVGFAAAGFGLASLAAGAYFGLDAIESRRARDRECDGSQCTARGLELDARGRRSADIANVAIGAGLAGAALGGVLLVRLGTREHRHVEAAMDPLARTARVRVVF